MNRTPNLALAASIFVLWLATNPFRALAAEQIDGPEPEAKTSAPVAFVYVSNSSSKGGDVYAYAAASDGQLTPVSGSPFEENVTVGGVNGKYLFASDANGGIDSFLMAADGAISKVSSVNTKQYNPDACYPPGGIKIDHTGTTLYNLTFDPDCFGTHYQLFKIQSSTGKLVYAGESAEQNPAVFELDFLGSNKFAYAPLCDHSEFSVAAGMFGFTRESSGVLDTFSLKVTPPATPQKGNFYCPLTLATDPTSHVVALLEDDDGDGDTYGQTVIGTFTADADGNLSTTNTYHTMPVAAGAFAMRMSPTGKLLAVSGSKGLEIFHFNGASPATEFRTLLPNTVLTQAFWDNNNHLYVAGGNAKNAGKLWVYTVTPTSITEAPGSPYSIPNPYQVIVQPK